MSLSLPSLCSLGLHTSTDMKMISPLNCEQSLFLIITFHCWLSLWVPDTVGISRSSFKSIMRSIPIALKAIFYLRMGIYPGWLWKLSQLHPTIKPAFCFKQHTLLHLQTHFWQSIGRHRTSIWWRIISGRLDMLNKGLSIRIRMTRYMAYFRQL
jgi:hypothetical protein